MTVPQSRPRRRGQLAESRNRKRSVIIGGRKTSVGMEEAFWQAIKEIARVRNMPIYKLVAEIDAEREHKNLSSAIRVFVLNFYQNQT